jgi:4-diphosphocytidyl-2-C-methyl-D-erythritol kinase
VSSVHRPAEVTLDVPAKINLTLEVLRRRDDGYHDLASVMQAIDLSDTLRVRVRKGTSGIALAAGGAEVPQGPPNLAYKAAAAFLAAVAERPAGEPRLKGSGIEIELTKRIPVGAGLGGGSADAAAVLLALNRLAGGPLGAGRLHRLAAGIGSDVPFLLTGGTCLVGGRGERLRRLPPLPSLWIVVVAPAVPVETRWAYGARSERELTGTGSSSRMLESAIRRGSAAQTGLYLLNDLEVVVAERYPVVGEVLEAMRGEETIGAGMSGSGSSSFALVTDHAKALRLAERLHRFNHPVHVCRPLRRGPSAADEGGFFQTATC